MNNFLYQFINFTHIDCFLWN